jgi:hypothetical protein
MYRNLLLSAVAILALGLAACSKENSQNESPFRLTATIQDIMDAEVDPAADFIWGAVAYVSSKEKTEDKQPRTDAEWETVRRNAIILLEATNLLSMPGRTVADPGRKLDPTEVAGIEDPKDIEKAIAANPANFIGFAHALHDAGMEAYKAIVAKDVAALSAAGEKLDTACENCHRTYWYPNAPEPIKTLEPEAPGK